MEQNEEVGPDVKVRRRDCPPQRRAEGQREKNDCVDAPAEFRQDKDVFKRQKQKRGDKGQKKAQPKELKFLL
jgi:hypothetical protein